MGTFDPKLVKLFATIIAFGLLCNASPIQPSSDANQNETGSKSSSDLSHKRDFIRNMTLHGWNNYVQYAWSSDRLNLVNKTAKRDPVGNTGATILAAMSTLHLMGLSEQFNKGRDFFETTFDFPKRTEDVHVYLATVRALGSVLSAYSLSNDTIFLMKAEELRNMLEPGFSNSTGLLYRRINPDHVSKTRAHTKLSHIGFQQPELIYLAALKNDSDLKQKVDTIRSKIANATLANGLYGNSIDVETGEWAKKKTTLDRTQLEFYRNMINSYVMTGSRDEELVKMFTDAIAAMDKNGLIVQTQNGLTVIRVLNTTTNEFEMLFGESSCQFGAILARAALAMNDKQSDLKVHYGQLASNLTQTCHSVAKSTATELLPEEFRLTKDISDVQIIEKVGMLSNQLAENYFLLWRLTHESKYREWAWDLAQAIEQHARTEVGYADIGNVNDVPTEKYIYQPYDIFSSTFFYLYLTFTEDSVLPLDKWIFNSVGHPLPICGKHSAYPQNLCL